MSRSMCVKKREGYGTLKLRYSFFIPMLTLILFSEEKVKARKFAFAVNKESEKYLIYFELINAPLIFLKSVTIIIFS